MVAVVWEILCSDSSYALTPHVSIPFNQLSSTSYSRGFLEERRALRQATTSTNCGPAWLFFGCRHPDHDFLYQSELDSYLADGTLDRLEVAFSRTQAHKIYVQDKIRDLGAEVAELMLRPGAGVFVCGDGMGMAAGVHDALQSVLSARLGDGQGASVLESMAREGRYVRDIWT